MRVRPRTSLRMLGALGLAACADLSTTGEAGEGRFQYACISAAADPACSEGNQSVSPTDRPFPSAVALGARFRVSCRDDKAVLDTNNEPGGAVGPTNTLPAAEFLKVGADGSTMLAVREGVIGLLCQERSSGRVLDITHLRVIPPAAIQIRDVGDGHNVEPRRQLDLFRSLTLAAVAHDGVVGSIAGTLTATWTTSDPEIVKVNVSPSATGASSTSAPVDLVTVSGGKKGVARVTAKAAGVEAFLDLEVTEGLSL